MGISLSLSESTSSNGHLNARKTLAEPHFVRPTAKPQLWHTFDYCSRLIIGVCLLIPIHLLRVTRTWIAGRRGSVGIRRGSSSGMVNHIHLPLFIQVNVHLTENIVDVWNGQVVTRFLQSIYSNQRFTRIRRNQEPSRKHPSQDMILLVKNRGGNH